MPIVAVFNKSVDIRRKESGTICRAVIMGIAPVVPFFQAA
jgi:hypothetical protein